MMLSSISRWMKKFTDRSPPPPSLLRILQSIDIADIIYCYLLTKDIINCECRLSSIISYRLSSEDRIKRLKRFFRYDRNKKLIRRPYSSRRPDRYSTAIPYSLWSNNPDYYSQWVSALYDVNKVDKKFSDYSNIKSIELSVHFNDPIPPHSLPPALERLFIGSSYNHPLLSSSLPPCLLSFEFDESSRFNQIIDPGILPSSLIHLSFGEYFNQSFSPGTLPSSLQRLIFGQNFNQKLEKEILPSSLTELEFGVWFNQSIDIGVLPSSIKKLIFGRTYNKIIDRGVLPSSLTELQFGIYYNQSIDIGVLPSSLTKSIFDNQYDRCLYRGILPSSLVSLTLGDTYNHPLSIGTFPSSLKILILGEQFNHPIKKGLLSEGFEELIINNNKYRYPLIKGDNIPLSIKKIIIKNPESIGRVILNSFFDSVGRVISFGIPAH